MGVPFLLCFPMDFYWFWVPSGTSLFIKKLRKQRFGTTCDEHEKRVRKNMIFKRLEPQKVNPRAGESMILRFCPSPEKHSILRLFWYLLFELLGSPIVENLSCMGTGSAINYESLANICKKFPQTLTEFTYISICLIII